ncbi:MAG: AmmeMemoRadiSam system protein B [bacterium]|nr:AmmeMemoRadiSam system protein B [bacterium]
MPIIFSAITPHSPILVPSIGKENLSRLKATESAMEKLEEDLRAVNPDTILIISPHGSTQQDAFTINLNPEFEANFKEFGDFTTKLRFNGDVGLAYKIRESLETKAPLQLISEPNLDYGSSIPLSLLTKKLPDVKIIPLHYCGLDLQAHFKFGQLLKREFMVNKNKVAIIASGDLSHKLSKDAPAGYSPKGKKFDKKIVDYLTKRKTAELLEIDRQLIAEAGECGLKSIVILLGILDGMNYEPKMLSYEAPFGVGYLVMNFKI